MNRSEWSKAADLCIELLEVQKSSTTSNITDDATNLGVLLRKAGRKIEARAHYLQWIVMTPENITLRLNGINFLLEEGDLDIAERWIEDGLERLPGERRLIQRQALLLSKRGFAEKAILLLRNACLGDEGDHGIWLDLSVLYEKVGSLNDAVRATEEALKIRSNCEISIANKIGILTRLGEKGEIHTLLSDLPESVKNTTRVRRAIADYNLAENKMVEAEAELARLCVIEPWNAGHWINRAGCLRSLKHFMTAISVLKDGIKWCPNDGQLQESLAHCLTETGKERQGIDLLRRVFDWESRLSNERFMSIQFLGSCYRLVDSFELKKIARKWENGIDPRLKPMYGDYIYSADSEKLRVGYMSSDLCNHPVGRFILPIIREHNLAGDSVVIISTGKIKDGVTDMIKSHSSEWVDAAYGTDVEISRIIAEKNVDALIELGGYTGNSRIDALRYRPAKLQLSYLGYPAPTYLEAIDGWIGDEEIFSGLDETDACSHKLLKLKGGYMCFEDTLPEPRLIKQRGFTFGCFNHSRKLSKETIRLFARCVREVEGATLLLKSISFVEEKERERIQEAFRQEGLDKDKVVVIPWVEGRHEHLQMYDLVDVCLDPSPYGGATTTCESLMMGVPVVTMKGTSMSGNLSASILVSAGLEDWIAVDENEFLYVAKKVSQKGRRELSDRRMLRRHISESNLCDVKRVTGEIRRIIKNLLVELNAE